jgi:hypothetical protein
MQKVECCIESGIRTEIYTLEGSEEPSRRAILTKDFPQGSVIFENEPYAHVVASQERSTICSSCFKSSTNLLICSKCQFSRYCSQTCQRNDWSSGHKSECRHAKDLRAEGCSDLALDEILLLLRTYSLCSGDKGLRDDNGIVCTSEISTSISTGPVRCGRAHVLDLCVGGEFDDVSIATLAEAVRRCSISKSKKYPCDPKTLLAPLSRLYASFRANNFCILNHLLIPKGAGVYPHAALLNHSCTPNGLLSFRFRDDGQGQPPLLQCIALSDLKAGEELTHCYVDSTLPTTERSLKASYGFDCQCERCNSAVRSNLFTNVNVNVDATTVIRNELCNINDVNNAYNDNKKNTDTNEKDDVVKLYEYLQQFDLQEKATMQAVVDNLQSPPELDLEVDLVLDTILKDIDDSSSIGTAGPMTFKDLLQHFCIDTNTTSSKICILVRVIENICSTPPFEYVQYSKSLYEWKSIAFTNLMTATTATLSDRERDQLGNAETRMRTLRSLCSSLCCYQMLTLRVFDFHPLLGLQLATLGQLNSDNMYEQSSQRHLKLSYQILNLSYGYGNNNNNCDCDTSVSGNNTKGFGCDKGKYNILKEIESQINS